MRFLIKWIKVIPRFSLPLLSSVTRPSDKASCSVLPEFWKIHREKGENNVPHSSHVLIPTFGSRSWIRRRKFSGTVFTYSSSAGVLWVCSQNEFRFDITMSSYGPSFPFFLAIVPNDAAITLWKTKPKVGCDELICICFRRKNRICLRGTHTDTHTSNISHLFWYIII